MQVKAKILKVSLLGLMLLLLSCGNTANNKARSFQIKELTPTFTVVATAIPTPIKTPEYTPKPTVIVSPTIVLIITPVPTAKLSPTNAPKKFPTIAPESTLTIGSIITSTVTPAVTPTVTLIVIPIVTSTVTPTVTLTVTPIPIEKEIFEPVEISTPELLKTPTTLNSVSVENIRIIDFKFDVAILEIVKGSVVKWVNKDSSHHTVFSEKGGFSSGFLSINQEFQFTFNNPGLYSYKCELHSNMKGTIRVK